MIDIIQLHYMKLYSNGNFNLVNLPAPFTNTRLNNKQSYTRKQNLK